MLEFPLVIINFKTFKEGTGKKAVELAMACERVAKSTKIMIAIAVQPTDLCCVSSAVSIPVLAQHVDPVSFGAHTGAILPEAVKQAGASGSILNHSEKRIPLETIKQSIKRLHELGMVAIVCADTPSLAAKIAKFRPDAIAIEPPELIGGNIAVSQAKPEVITKSTSKIKIPVLCGAGIHTGEDVAKAIELGAKGILVAHSVVTAKNPEKALKDLVNGL